MFLRSAAHPLRERFCFKTVAERTGLEPATPGVTGRYSNQLNYRSTNILGYCIILAAKAERLELPPCFRMLSLLVVAEKALVYSIF